MKTRLGILVAIVFLAAGLTTAQPADAFKPPTHLQAAFEAYDDAVDDGSVEVAGIEVAVDPEILTALRGFPEAYRAGVLGPDAYPDIYVGQSMIHPDTVTDNDQIEPQVGRFSVTDDWLQHVWDSAHDLPPGDERLEAIAFAVGFLTHAAGDIWGHTVVNDFANGVFPSLTKPEEAMIAVRHVIVEGYIDSKRPVPEPDPSNVAGIDPPDEFVVDTFILSDFARQHSAPLHFDLFFARRESLELQLAGVNADLRTQDRNGWGIDVFDAPNNPLERWYLEARRGTLNTQIADVDNGLERWPEFSTKIARAVLAPDSDFPAAQETAIVFGYSTVFPMVGIPRAVGEALLQLRAWWMGLTDAVRAVYAPVADLVAQVEELAINFLLDLFIDVSDLPPNVRPIVDLNGDGSLSLEELRNLSRNELLINNPGVLDPADKQRLDELIGLQNGAFDTQSFAAYRNTAVMSRLIFLDRDGLNSLGDALGAGEPLYAPESAENVMLGWVHSIDGDYQWRQNTLRAGDDRSFGSGSFPLWESCVARDTVFRTIFAEPLAGAFADAGDTCDSPQQL